MARLGYEAVSYTHLDVYKRQILGGTMGVSVCTELGSAGFAARAALGLGSLPGEAPVEIQMICAVE